MFFNKAFFNNTDNALANIIPEYADLAHVIQVIQVEDEFHGKELCVLMNSDLEKAMAFLIHPSNHSLQSDQTDAIDYEPENERTGWRWRHYMAEKIAEQIYMDAFSVKSIYLIGSTNSHTAKLNSDIDLLIHIGNNTTKEQKQYLDAWLQGWSLALSEINYLKTRYKTNGLLDYNYITDQDIQNKTSFAVKIKSTYDPAYPLRIREKQEDGRTGKVLYYKERYKKRELLVSNLM